MLLGAEHHFYNDKSGARFDTPTRAEQSARSSPHAKQQTTLSGGLFWCGDGGYWSGVRENHSRFAP